MEWPTSLRINCFCVLLLAVAVNSHAQGLRVRVPALAPPTTPTAPLPSPGSTCIPVSPSNLRITYIGSRQIGLAWTAPNTPSGCAFDHYVINCSYKHKKDEAVAGDTDRDIDCSPGLPVKFNATSYNQAGLETQVFYNYKVAAVYLDASGKSTGGDKFSDTVYAETTLVTCLLIPLRAGCMNFGSGKDANINGFWQTNSPYTFLGQVKSIYNGASGSANISADLGTLNFGDGMQVTVTTNAQAGPSGTTPSTLGVTPTLSSNGAGQAAQNMIFGGTFLISELYPILAVGAGKLGTPGAFGFSTDFIAREGADIQNFKSGTNFNVTSPPFHASGQLEGYVQYNSINFAPNNTQLFAGSLFAGGSYGYSYTSPAYLRDYGFSSKQNNGMGAISIGVVLNTVARISISRGFGPSQTYIDSTTMVSTRVNNFKAWSIGVTYQSATPTSKQ
jgi:hypothetical protein